MDNFEAMLLLMIVACGYFIPSIIASFRHHNNYAPIFLLNLFFGWTFAGWVAALIWSSTDNVKK